MNIKSKSLKWLGVLSLATTLSLQAVPLKIMFLGDSITVGSAAIPDNPEQNISKYSGDIVEFVDEIAYRGEFWKLLKEAGYRVDSNDSQRDIDFVGSKTKNESTFQEANPGFDEDHDGHKGFTSADLVYGRAISNPSEDNVSIDSILDANTPDVVLLHIGTNDPAKGIEIGEHNATNKDSNTTVNNVRKILDAIFAKNKNTKVFVARIIEARRAHDSAGGLKKEENRVLSTGAYRWYTKDLNDEIEKMVSLHNNNKNIKMVNLESGAGIIYNPCGTDLGDMQPFHDDGNQSTGYKYDYHPNHKGYKKIAQKWFEDLNVSKVLPDITPPVIELNGTNPQNIELGTEYIELNAIVTDDRDTNITVDINAGDVNMQKEGNYTVRYNAVDSAGNKAIEVSRTVVVSKAPDTQKPTITINGEESVEVEYSAEYKDAGATAKDDVDGDITDDINTTGLPIDTSKSGTYEIIYSVKDSAGNTGSATRTVVVLPDPALDANGNGIPDNQEKDWFAYNKATQTATLKPKGTLRVAEGLSAIPSVDEKSITLKSTKGSKTAYVKAIDTAEITTGFTEGSNNDATLGKGVFSAGSDAEIKNIDNKIIIQISTILAKDKTLIIGGK